MEIDYIEDVNGKRWKPEAPYTETNFEGEDLPKYYPACTINEIEGGRFEINYFDSEKFNKENPYLLNSKERFEHWVKPNAKVILYPSGIKLIKLK